MNNPPRKHHYVPAFYLKQWAGVDGELCQYRKVHNGKVDTKRRHPNATGFRIDLYKIAEIPEQDAQAVEMQFMRLIDEDAYRALEHIKTSASKPFPGDLRSAWTRFLLGFLFRNPEAVDQIKRHILLMWKEGIAALQEEYAKNRKPGQPEKLEARVAPAAPHIGFADFFAGLINNDRLGPAIHDMNFGVIDTAHADHSLLTSDRPLNMPLGLGDENAYIALPIGPRKVFIASRKRELISKVGRANKNAIVKMMNLGTVTQAREYVWGLSDAHRTFVQRKIAAIADRTLLTDDQRLEGIAAAKGESVDLLRAEMDKIPRASLNDALSQATPHGPLKK